MLRFETQEGAQAECDQRNAGKKTRHGVYLVTPGGFYTIGRNSGEAKANAADFSVAPVDSHGAVITTLAQLTRLSQNELSELKALLERMTNANLPDHDAPILRDAPRPDEHGVRG